MNASNDPTTKTLPPFSDDYLVGLAVGTMFQSMGATDAQLQDAAARLGRLKEFLRANSQFDDNFGAIDEINDGFTASFTILTGNNEP